MITTEYRVAGPADISIAIVADLHEFDPEPVISRLAEIRPDVIAVPGDLFENHEFGENLDKEDDTMFSYGSMLTSIRRSVLGEEVENAGYLTDHLLNLIAESRTDELEDEFQEKSQKYRDAIDEVTQCENTVHELGLSKEAKRTIDRYVSAVGHRWVLCGDYLYKAGMRDILLLLENR